MSDNEPVGVRQQYNSFKTEESANTLRLLALHKLGQKPPPCREERFIQGSEKGSRHKGRQQFASARRSSSRPPFNRRSNDPSPPQPRRVSADKARTSPRTPNDQSASSPLQSQDGFVKPSTGFASVPSRSRTVIVFFPFLSHGAGQ